MAGKSRVFGVLTSVCRLELDLLEETDGVLEGIVATGRHEDEHSIHPFGASVAGRLVDLPHDVGSNPVFVPQATFLDHLLDGRLDEHSHCCPRLVADSRHQFSNSHVLPQLCRTIADELV